MTIPGQFDSTWQFDLTGKVAVVTGGSRGLGLAMARGLAGAGADVVIASRKLDACEAAANEIARATGQRAVAVACHVGNWSECDTLIDATLEEFERIDILVNNAGMSPLYPDLVSVTEELYDKTLAVNLKGPFRLGARRARTWWRMVADPSSTSARSGRSKPARGSSRTCAPRRG